jgi:hypothetical protein
MAKLAGVFHPWYTEESADGTRVRRTSKAWAYRFEYRGRTYQKAGFATAAAAQAARDTRRNEVRAGLETDWRELTLETVQRMASSRRVTWTGNTAANFDSVWKRLFRYFAPAERVASIDDTRILKYVDFAHRAGLRTNTIRADLGYLHSAMVIAHRKRLLPWLPEFPRLKAEPREQTVAPAQLAQLLAQMPEQWHLYFEATEEMGWRARSEVASRQWCHVDWGPERWECCGQTQTADACACGAGRPGWLELDAASNKTRERRLFPMTRVLRDILTRARSRVEECQRRTGGIIPWVFCRDNGERLGSSAKAWKVALAALHVRPIREAGGPWSAAIVPHDIRRSAIRRMHREGVSREVRKGLVGHASDSAHTRYEAKGADLDSMREAAQELDRRRLSRAGAKARGADVLAFQPAGARDSGATGRA